MVTNFSFQTMEAILESWHEFYGYEWRIEICCAYQCCWWAELRIITQLNRKEGADIGTTFYASAKGSPDEAASLVFNEALGWRDELDRAEKAKLVLQ